MTAWLQAQAEPSRRMEGSRAADPARRGEAEKAAHRDEAGKGAPVGIPECGMARVNPIPRTAIPTTASV
jgi:hypothetical protein